MLSPHEHVGSSIVCSKGHANVLQPGQLKFKSVSASPPVSNVLLALTLMVSDHLVVETTLSANQMLILNIWSNRPSGGNQRSEQRLCLMSDPGFVKFSQPQAIRKTGLTQRATPAT